MSQDTPASTPEPEPAGSPWAERIAAVDGLSGRPLAEHADAYDALHIDLKRRLGEVDGH